MSLWCVCLCVCVVSVCLSVAEYSVYARVWVGRCVCVCYRVQSVRRGVGGQVPWCWAASHAEGGRKGSAEKAVIIVSSRYSFSLISDNRVHFQACYHYRAWI